MASSSSWDRLRASRTSHVSIAACGPPPRLATLTRAMLRMGSFRPPPEAAPLLPVPHALAVMPLDGGDLEIIGVPLVTACAAMWPLALCRATVVVALEHHEALDEACALVGASVVMADQLVPFFTEEDEEAVASLFEAAIERAR